ncbi:MAG: hypothetical protein AMXMBFR4_33780 [Candidatus Hydrogenedentota bacterium]
MMNQVRIGEESGIALVEVMIATGYFERLISKHPDWPGIHNTYIQMLT